MQLLLVLKYVACAFMDARFRHERKLIELFLNRNLANMYIRHLRRFRRDIPKIRHTQTRQVMTFNAVLINVEMYNKSLDILKPLLLEWSYQQTKMEIFRKFIKDITFIQVKIKGALKAKFGKLEMLQSYWDKLLGQLQSNATLRKDKNLSQMCLQIVLVPSEVQ